MTLMDLNLLPSGAKFQAVKIKLQKKVRTIMAVILSVWVVAVVIIFGLILLAKVRTAAAESQFKKAQSAYMALADNIVTNQRLKYRAKIVGEVLDKRFEYSKAFEAVNSFFPSEVSLTSFNIKSQGKFQLLAATTDGKSLDKVEKVIVDINNQRDTKFKSAKMTTLSYSNGKWIFSVEVGLK